MLSNNGVVWANAVKWPAGQCLFKVQGGLKYIGPRLEEQGSNIRFILSTKMYIFVLKKENCDNQSKNSLRIEPVPSLEGPDPFLGQFDRMTQKRIKLTSNPGYREFLYSHVSLCHRRGLILLFRYKCRDRANYVSALHFQEHSDKMETDRFDTCLQQWRHSNSGYITRCVTVKFSYIGKGGETDYDLSSNSLKVAGEQYNLHFYFELSMNFFFSRNVPMEEVQPSIIGIPPPTIKHPNSSAVVTSTDNKIKSIGRIHNETHNIP